LTQPAAKRNSRDLICLSHLRWNFVFQRPQHLMTRAARDRRVFFFEEPIFDSTIAELHTTRDQNVFVCVPHLPHGLTPAGITNELRRLLHELRSTHNIDHPVLWYYTPMALDIARHIPASVVVFDCMDELSAFRGAPTELLTHEAELLTRADLVFTGGQSLFEAKRERHRRVFAFPSSVDVPHFAKAREGKADPADQADIPHPRLGFFGVVDERMDLELLDAVATRRPEWHFVILGPCVKIDPASLPRHDNIHYLGMKRYEELPAYLSGWDVALLPFAKNESTRFISPTKTLEYMAAELPIVSTPITDVAEPYGDIVYLGDTPEQFLAACEAALDSGTEERAGRAAQMRRVLAGTSWDVTVSAMEKLLAAAVAKKSTVPA
jgi:UDP-galactopyranose mutase